MLKQGALLFLLAGSVLLAIGGGCTAPAEVPATGDESEVRQAIEVETDGLTCHYLCQTFKGEEFAAHLADQAQFEVNAVKDFEQGLMMSDRPVSASGYSFFFDSANRAIICRCDVHGAISQTDDTYRATFFWLLRPLDLDFIDDDFEESEKGLFWQGLVNGVPTTVNVTLPTVDSLVYGAWGNPVGHCHAHVWWGEP
jgi:hypothetical protein